MPEAIEGRPGHVGWTPQHVGETIDAARRRGVESSGVVAAMVDEAVPLVNFLGGPTPNPQRYGHVATQHTLAAAEEYAHRERQLAPWLEPASKWPDTYEEARLPLPFISDRENRAQRPWEES